MESFSESNFRTLCRQLARKDAHLKNILDTYGYPPMWSRPNSFQTLVLTILEQQVSLASAYAAFKKLKERVGRVTPSAILSLSDEELRGCYFSRQKIVYVRELAGQIESGTLSLRRLANQDETTIRTTLKALKGIGDWTVDIYLIHVLQRPDIFPLGDIALVNSIRHVKSLPPDTTKEDLEMMSEAWRPYRTIATMMFWHHYINRKGMKILG